MSPRENEIYHCYIEVSPSKGRPFRLTISVPAKSVEEAKTAAQAFALKGKKTDEPELLITFLKEPFCGPKLEL